MTVPLNKNLDVEFLMSSLGDNISNSSHMEKSLPGTESGSRDSTPPPQPAPGSAQNSPSRVVFLIVECAVMCFLVVSPQPDWGYTCILEPLNAMLNFLPRKNISRGKPHIIKFNDDKRTYFHKKTQKI